MSKKVIIKKEDIEEALRLGLTRIQMAERFKCGVVTLDRHMREYGLEYLKNTYFYAGDRNPAKNPEVKRKIANTVKTLWDEGYYDDRVNGMKDVCGKEHPNYDFHKHHKNNFRDYLAQYQDVTTCSECGTTNEKIDVHHIDEDHENWLTTNLEPLCVKCHQKKHFKSRKQPYVTIGVKSHFDSCHNLYNYEGQCARLHGHRYFYEIQIRQRIHEDTGMVMDFKDLKKHMKIFEGVVDHQYLNDVLPFNPTAENMCAWIFEFFAKRLLVKGVVCIRLWETPNCVTEFTYKDMLEMYKGLEVEDIDEELGGEMYE